MTLKRDVCTLRRARRASHVSMPHACVTRTEPQSAGLFSSLPRDVLLLVLWSALLSKGYSVFYRLSLVNAALSALVGACLDDIVESICIELQCTIEHVQRYHLTPRDKDMLLHFKLEDAAVEVRQKRYRCTVSKDVLLCEVWHGITVNWKVLELRYQIFIRPSCSAYMRIPSSLVEKPYIVCDETHSINGDDMNRFKRSHYLNASALFTRIMTIRGPSARPCFNPPGRYLKLALRRRRTRGRDGIQMCILLCDGGGVGSPFPFREMENPTFRKQSAYLIEEATDAFSALPSTATPSATRT